ncbi:D-hexose-6-phosphate mutarotase [Bifidobacterium felsineum]|uniref:Putative glucose-6-phosphate 1-epimerase n=1 Tax=Bifidobacterium felsineum TaxID=2045440 RepID=A0A2M9HLK8_9BIFI|nr:D-hexose-6-phosphate mutarotase [Bifidobacterium felsineum]PJM77690.1 D-hexose-6-phosphate mutarotase [Bifidobacterium felsineum]
MSSGFALRNLNNSRGSAAVSDYGAHVLRWRPADQNEDVVWSPSSVILADNKAIVGGVPIVFPWFGPGFADGHGLGKKPNHGFGRIRTWQLDAESFSHEYAHYTLDSADLEPGDVPWLEPAEANESAPTPQFHADFEVHATDTLTMTLTVANTGTVPFSYEAALHTYFHVSDVSNVRLAGLGGAHYADATDGFKPCVQSDPEVTFNGTVDRVYESDSTLELHDAGLQRTIRIAKSGSPQTVVWNPGKPYGTFVNDETAGEWRGFICAEAASCREHAVALAPGESHALSQSLSVA